MSPSDELKEAWRVWATLKEERAIAMANVKGGICADWWRKEELRAGDEWMDGEDEEDEAQDDGHAEEAEKVKEFSCQLWMRRTRRRMRRGEFR